MLRLTRFARFRCIRLGARLWILAVIPALAMTMRASAGPGAVPSPALRRMVRDTVRQLLRRALADSAFPGAYAVIGTRRAILASVGVGHLDWAPSPPTDENTLWDLASLTKVVGTTTAMMQLWEHGAVALDTPVTRYLPELSGAGVERVTVRDLLSHSSGLPAWRPIYKEAATPAEGFALVFATPLDTVPGARYVYSDLGAIMLGKVVERVSGEPLDGYLERHIFAPLAMRSTRFRPPPSWRARIAPTEVDPWRNRHLRGEVHDENAFALGGVAGHAGLFSSAHDLTHFAQMLLGGGMLHGRRIVSPATLDTFTHVRDSAFSNRALGWEVPNGQNSAGHRMGSRAFGHTGFTGTSLWIDPERDLFVILLTNRVNPTRSNPRLGPVRVELADAVEAVLAASNAIKSSSESSPMNLSLIDWAIVVAYFALSAGIGLYFTKRGGESLDEYFLSGRRVSWWLAGASMVATTFAADTPLVVTGLVAANGVAGNWLWWNMLMSGMLTVFFFARLWRRANVMTDVELAEVRYSGRPAAVLRGFRAIYLGFAINLIILGWVTRAMIKILTVSLGLHDVSVAGFTLSGEVVAVGICFLITAAYAVAAGMWAVLWTDLVQFVIKMSAVIVLAVYAVRAVGGMGALRSGLAAHFGSERAALSVLPVRWSDGHITAYPWMPLLALGVFLSVQWWAAWYPGAEPGGGGYVAQRIFSARTERDGVLATLFFQLAHYAIRPWPWIVTGLATVLLYPNLQDRESGYVKAFVDLLPTPWRGFMMAGFAAAYMSTVGTQLNWGASYLVNDFYKRFLKPNETQHHYVSVSRATTIFLFFSSVFVTANLTTVEGAWKFLLALGSGTGLVLILRWYWWRINAWSEISAMITSFLVSMVALTRLRPMFPPGDLRADAWVMLVTVGVSTVVWVSVTFLTAPEPDAHLEAFYRRVRPGGPGWARISTQAGFGREQIPGGALAWTNWLAGVIAVYATLFGIGKVVFGEMVPGIIMLAIAAAGFAWIAKSFREEAAETARGHGSARTSTETSNRAADLRG